MEELREGTVICKREFSIWRRDHDWTFHTVKKITPTGKIRLANGDLLSDMGSYKIYDEELQRIYMEDKAKYHLKNMIYYIDSNKNNIINNLTTEEVIMFVDVLEKLNIENTERWDRDSDKEGYENHLKEFIKSRNDISNK